MNLTNCIHKILTCSTAHITREDNDLLKRGRGVGLPGGHVYHDILGGWLFILTPNEHVTDIGAWQLAGWSDSLYHLVNNALHRKCRYVRLDSDAEQVTGWATHDW